MQRYFSVLKDGQEVLSDDDLFHITHVMRSRLGDHFEMVGNDFIFVMEVDKLNPFSFHVISKRLKKELPHNITLLYCLPKGDKLDLVIQKATELGVKEIIGLISKRTIVRLDDKDIAKKQVRYERIIKEACEQCERDDLMKWGGVLSFSAIKDLYFDKKYIAYEGEKGITCSFYDEMLKLDRNNSVAILVGPEGGFEKEEVEYANKCGYVSISLGKRVLRSETAAILSVGLLSFMLERDE